MISDLETILNKDKKMIDQLKSKSLEFRKLKSPMGATMAFHISEIQRIGKSDGDRETTSDEIILYLKKTVHKLKSQSLSNKEEIKTLESFLPEMVSQDALRSFIFNIKDLDKGMAMKAIREQYGVLVDMQMASSIYAEFRANN